MLDPYTDGEDKTNPKAQSGVTVPQKWKPRSGPPPSYGGQAEGGPYKGKRNPGKGKRDVSKGKKNP